MQVLYPRCAGLDVHKKTVVACRVHTLPNGHKQQEIATFGTTTPELLQLGDWLREGECTHVAMESTGEYWKPVYNLLEGDVELLVVNASHMKAVPGKKTDVKDAEWLADLLRHGLLKASFVPPREQRDLRELTRQRTKLIEEQARVANRIQKVLESANIKLSGVATDITGVSARAMLKQLVEGETDAAAMAALARGKMRKKREELEAALTGSVREHHRFLLAEHLKHLEFLEARIQEFNERIAAQIDRMSPPSPSATEAPAAPQEAPSVPAPAPDLPALCARPVPLTYRQAIPVLDAVPGIDVAGAENILAELGTEMGQYPSAAHAASWTGIAPGNYESAGKQRKGKAPPGNKALRKALVQAARGAIRTKNSYFGALYRRVCARRGDKRAVVAVAHALLVVIYHLLLRQEPYHELGAHYLDAQHPERTAKRLLARLERLGYQITIEAQPALAAA